MRRSRAILHFGKKQRRQEENDSGWTVAVGIGRSGQIQEIFKR